MTQWVDQMHRGQHREHKILDVSVYFCTILMFCCQMMLAQLYLKGQNVKVRVSFSHGWSFFFLSFTKTG